MVACHTKEGDEPMRAGEAFARDDSVLQRALTAQTLRLQATAHNMANANTPGFKRLAVSFESALREELGAAAAPGRLPLRTTHPRHLTARGAAAGEVARPRVVRDESTTMRNDGNNVDPDREMAELARTQLVYQALTRVVSERYRRLRAVVQQGGR